MEESVANPGNDVEDVQPNSSPSSPIICNGNGSIGNVPSRGPIHVLKDALKSVPNQSTESMLKNVACKLAESYVEQVCTYFMKFI